MGPIEALAHRSTPVDRLLKLATTWPDALPDKVATSPRVPYRTMRQLQPVEIDELVAGYQAGATVFELAARFGQHRATIGRHLQARGVDTTPPALSSMQIEEATELYGAGWSLAKIAKKYGVNDGTVWRRLRAVGVKMRSPNGHA